ncbi:hypothetical protein PENTCL1PPCAC_5508 [Pristionchus entomophagus]|uniref:Uncharacterized protein n=1 Tax=Pristionchus entomophagus TaxID=358040 RepID=A0AAV5SMJ6_9BILA|nr:hypothetical protein PENTCL1PPCAC_5508 [Pristionchus entomophagus]
MDPPNDEAQLVVKSIPELAQKVFQEVAKLLEDAQIRENSDDEDVSTAQFTAALLAEVKAELAANSARLKDNAEVGYETHENDFLRRQKDKKLKKEEKGRSEPHNEKLTAGQQAKRQKLCKDQERLRMRLLSRQANQDASQLVLSAQEQEMYKEFLKTRQESS